jgi:predicted DsbA family dithiol-disulfide isomerase
VTRNEPENVVTHPTEAEPLTVDVVSDVVCPWCYLGKRRLEQAIALADIPVAVRWHPFQLDPTIPPGGKSRRAYLEGKFGSMERVAPTHANIAAAGAEIGIPFHFDRIERSPNTLDAHRLSRWAAAAGRQDEVVEALFRAYFTDGRDIGDPAVLSEIAGEAGLDADAIAARLASEEDRAEVEAEIASAQQIGVTGVPTYIVAGRYGVVGAQAPEALAKAFRDIAAGGAVTVD